MALVIILARGSLRLGKPPRPDEEFHEFGDVKEGNGRVPLLIWLVFFGWGLWATGYVIFRSLTASAS